MTIVKKYCYGLIEPSSGENQVNGMVSIDIARLDPQAARRRDKSNRLQPDCGELELNPVVSIAGTVWPSLNAGQIWTHISVKIGNGKLWARSNRSDRRILNVCSCYRTAASEAK